MKISEFQSVLSRVQSACGDIDVVLKDAEHGAETVLQDVDVKLGLSADGSGSVATLTHGAAPVEVEQPTETPAEPALVDPTAAGVTA